MMTIRRCLPYARTHVRMHVRIVCVSGCELMCVIRSHFGSRARGLATVPLLGLASVLLP